MDYGLVPRRGKKVRFHPAPAAPASPTAPAPATAPPSAPATMPPPLTAPAPLRFAAPPPPATARRRVVPAAPPSDGGSESEPEACPAAPAPADPLCALTDEEFLELLRGEAASGSWIPEGFRRGLRYVGACTASIVTPMLVKYVLDRAMGGMRTYAPQTLPLPPAGAMPPGVGAPAYGLPVWPVPAVSRHAAVAQFASLTGLS